MLTLNYITTRVKARLSVYYITFHSTFLPSMLILSIKGYLKVKSNENISISVRWLLTHARGKAAC